VEREEKEEAEGELLYMSRAYRPQNGKYYVTVYCAGAKTKSW
jgi:hypothetical protein